MYCPASFSKCVKIGSFDSLARSTTSLTGPLFTFFGGFGERQALIIFW
jgi:hypothetical protein